MSAMFGWLDREQEQRRGAEHQAELGEGQQTAPVDGVGDGAGAEAEHEDRDELEERQQPEREGAAGQQVDLERQRDPCDLVARAVDRLPSKEPSEVVITAERSDVDEDPPQAATPFHRSPLAVERLDAGGLRCLVRCSLTHVRVRSLRSSAAPCHRRPCVRRMVRRRK